MDLKKLSIIVLLAALFIIGISHSDKPNDFPDKDVFNLEVSCEDRMTLGETANIVVSFSSNGKYEYEIAFSNMSFFEVLVHEERLTKRGNGTFTNLFSPGEKRSNTYTFIPDKTGVYKIKVIVAFEVRLSPTDTKEYSYEKSVSITVTE